MFNQTFKRYLRFGFVGASGVVVDMVCLFILFDPKKLGLNLTFSKAIAAEIAIFNNFIWNELWTFSDLSVVRNRWRQRLGRLARFNLICLAGIVLSILILNVQVRFIALNVYLENLIAIILVSFWNFAMNLKLGWSQLVTK